MVPARFEEDIQEIPKISEDGAVDVRVLDHDTIEMASMSPPLLSRFRVTNLYKDKFHAFTEPLIRSVFTNDLNAELPLDLSNDEGDVINHVGTSSLILGRSGTGKTTCLVYKLVAQFLAGKRLKDQKPKRQVS